MLTIAQWRGATRTACGALLAAGALILAGSIALPAAAADPIKIGFSMGLTGGNAPNGNQLLLALETWRADINAKGGLLGRPVEFVYYDDQTMPPNEPGIYTKLIEVDKVDLILGPYGTNQITAGIPVIAQHKFTTIGMLGTGANGQTHYANYFSMIPLGQDPIHNFSHGFFELAMEQTPKPKTVAIVGTDAEFGKNSTDGARDNAKAVGLKIVYDQRYPPSTTDFTPIVHAIQATKPDIVFVASYPPDTVGFVRAAAEVGLKPKMMGGTMIGLLATPLKIQMGPLMNGYVNNEIFVPSFKFQGTDAMLAEYQERAKGKKVDPLGYGFAPFGYAAAQVLGLAVEATQSLDQQKIADYMHTHSFSTVAGEVAFGKDGEWVHPRMAFTQWQGLTDNSLAQIKDPAHWVVIWPAQYKTGTMIYPYGKAK
jgi:branched-chain amino acid transport system substrate-binding protein